MPLALATATLAYHLATNEQGYSLDLSMKLPAHVSLDLAVSAFGDSTLAGRLNPSMTEMRVADSPDPSEYRKLVTLSHWGIKTQLVSECRETADAAHWTRSCTLLPESAQGITKAKVESASCEAGPPVRCSIRVEGKLGGFLWISPAGLTIRAKAQALANWARFGFYLAGGALSAREAIARYEASAAPREIERLQEAGLAAADRPPYRYDSRAMLVP